MQVALLIPQDEWHSVLDRLGQLEAQAAAATLATTATPEQVLNVRQAAQALHMTEAGIRKARRAGRLQGVRLNEKEWGFRRSTLDSYRSRYHPRDRASCRAAQAA